MTKEIKIAVISSVVTALLSFAGANSLGAFKSKLIETDINEAAKIIVNEHSDILIRKLKNDAQFISLTKGDKGMPGIQGPKGDPGSNASCYINPFIDANRKCPFGGNATSWFKNISNSALAAFHNNGSSTPDGEFKASWVAVCCM